MFLLEPQEIGARHPQQKPVTSFNATVRQGWKDALIAALQFQHVHIKAALQAAVAEGLSDQHGVAGNGDFGEIADLSLVGAQLILWWLAIGQEQAWCQKHVGRTREPDRHADGGKAEQLQGAVAQLLTHVTGEQIHGAAQQGEGAAKEGGEGQGQKDARWSNPAFVAPGFQYWQQTRHDGGVGHNTRNGCHHQRQEPHHAPGAADALRGN